MLFLLVLACSSPEPKAPPPPPAPAPRGPAVSGAVMQDPSGFPLFHDWPAPPGPAIEGLGDWTAPVKLSAEPGGGYRPQIVAGRDGTLHAVYYERDATGDLIRHRRASAHEANEPGAWSRPVPAGFDRDRNWGPDLVAREDGSVVMVFDHAKADLSSRGYLTIWDGRTWSPPEPLTPDDGGEVGSGHVADGPGADLAYVFIGKPLDPTAHFQARWRWFHGGRWTEAAAFTDGTADAWHTNVERRPDGSVLAGFDVGTGGSATRLFVAEGRDGGFGPLEDLTATGQPGERPHFAFGEQDHLTWFHKEQGRPVHVYVRSGGPGRWGPVEEPSRGYGGFHFDPEVAVDGRGNLCLVWGWDAGGDAELVYAVKAAGGTWTTPRKVAEIDWGKPGLASLVADEQDRFHVVWNQGVRGDNDVYYARLELP